MASPLTVLVALQEVPLPLTEAAFPLIKTVGVLAELSDVVKLKVMTSPVLANAVLVLFDAIEATVTVGNVEQVSVATFIFPVEAAKKVLFVYVARGLELVLPNEPAPVPEPPRVNVFVECVKVPKLATAELAMDKFPPIVRLPERVIIVPEA